MNGFFITGTDTEIGKTLLTSLLALGLLKHDVNCCPVKPIATGGVLYEGRRISEDALFYKKIIPIGESLSQLNPFCLIRPASPHFVAEIENQSFDLPHIFQKLQNLSEKYEFLLIEGIGGWLVPLTYNYLVADFAKDIGLPVILISANKLGTINHTLLTLESIRGRGIEPMGVIFTKLSPDSDPDLEKNNVETVRKIGKTEIIGKIPYLHPHLFDEKNAHMLWKEVQNTIQWNKIIESINTHKTK